MGWGLLLKARFASFYCWVFMNIQTDSVILMVFVCCYGYYFLINSLPELFKIGKNRSFFDCRGGYHCVLHQCHCTYTSENAKLFSVPRSRSILPLNWFGCSMKRPVADGILKQNIFIRKVCSIPSMMYEWRLWFEYGDRLDWTQKVAVLTSILSKASRLSRVCGRRRHGQSPLCCPSRVEAQQRICGFGLRSEAELNI